MEISLKNFEKKIINLDINKIKIENLEKNKQQ